MPERKEWEGFKGKIWKDEINTRDFIQENYTPYDGDETFLVGPTDATDKLWGKLQELQKLSPELVRCICRSYRCNGQALGKASGASEG